VAIVAPTSEERTMAISLFEREMRTQLAAAEAAVTDAETSTDPVVIQAARNHLDNLLALARRNGLTLESLSAPDEISLVQPTAPAV
jgi:phytoene/squalene synthetase